MRHGRYAHYGITRFIDDLATVRSGDNETHGVVGGRGVTDEGDTMRCTSRNGHCPHMSYPMSDEIPVWKVSSHA